MPKCPLPQPLSQTKLISSAEVDIEVDIVIQQLPGQITTGAPNMRRDYYSSLIGSTWLSNSAIVDDIERFLQLAASQALY